MAIIDPRTAQVFAPGGELPSWSPANAYSHPDLLPDALRDWVRDTFGLEVWVIDWLDDPRALTGARPVHLELRGVRAAFPNDDVAWRQMSGAFGVPTEWSSYAAWHRPGWLDDVLHWVSAQVGVDARSVRQLRSRIGSSILRIETNGDEMYFKAVPTMYRREIGVLAWLGRESPGAGPEVVAADPARGWLLTRSLGAVDLSRADATAWARALDSYAQLQLRSVSSVPELLALGCLDLRLGELIPQLEVLLEQPWLQASLADGELVLLRSGLPRLRRLVHDLAACGIPDTIEHGDLIPTNVFVVDEAPRVIDWADTSVSHPFLSALRLLRYLDDNPWARDHTTTVRGYRALRDGYLEHFAAVSRVSQAVLRDTFDASYPLCMLQLALNYAQLAVTAEGTPWERDGMLSKCLRSVIADTCTPDLP